MVFRLTNLIGLAMLLALTAITIGCGTDPTATPTATPRPEATPTPTVPPIEAEWQQLIEDAKAEGQLVLTGGTALEPLTRFFGEEFGIEVIHQTGSGRALSDRILAERSRGIYEVDITLFGSGSTGRIIGADGAEPILPLLLDRDNIVDRSENWQVDRHLWMQPEKQYNPGWHKRADDNFMHIAYNTEKVTQAELDNLNSWFDLLEPEWTGRMGSVLEPQYGGGMSGRVFGWVFVGSEWYEPFIREQSVTFYNGEDARTIIDDLARGSIDLIAAFPSATVDQLEEAVEIGLPVKLLEKTMEEGTVAEIRGEGVILKNAPHPRAAQLFMNWLLSSDGQTAYHEVVEAPEPSLRTDVPRGRTGDELWAMHLSVSDNPDRLVDITTPQFVEARAETIAYLEEIFTELGMYGY